MEIVEVPVQPIEIVESVVNDKQLENQTEVTPIESTGNNQAESSNHVESIKDPEPELAPHVPVEENRPADASVSPSSDNEPLVALDRPLSPQSSRAEVVTPAGTVEAPHRTLDSPRAETAKEGALPKTNEPAALVVENEPHNIEDIVDEKGQKVADSLEQSFKSEVQEVIRTTLVAPSAEPALEAISAASNGNEQANSDSFASDEVLAEVQNFFTLQIVENRCSSHSTEIHEFVEEHLNEKQRERYVALLVERIAQQFTQEATAKGEELSIDVQSNICLIEQMFLTLGRRSPLQDMYSEEEEQMLDLLFHSNSSDNLDI